MNIEDKKKLDAYVKEQLGSYLATRQGTKKVSKGCFITLNPPPEFDKEYQNYLPGIISEISGLISKKWVDSLAFVVEQRATVKPYYGIHFHILIVFKHYYKKSYILRILASYFSKRSATFTLQKNNINVQMCKRTNDLQNCHEYILGNKEDDKMDKSRLDAQFRLDNNLKPYYKSDNYTLI